MKTTVQLCLTLLVIFWVHDMPTALTQKTTTTPSDAAGAKQQAKMEQDEGKEASSWKIPLIVLGAIAGVVLVGSIAIITVVLGAPYFKRRKTMGKAKEETGKTEQESFQQPEPQRMKQPQTLPAIRVEVPVQKIDETEQTPKKTPTVEPKMVKVRVDDTASLSLSEKDDGVGYKVAEGYKKTWPNTQTPVKLKPELQAHQYRRAPKKWMDPDEEFTQQTQDDKARYSRV